MASQEHLAMFQDETTSTSSDDDGSDTEESLGAPATATSEDQDVMAVDTPSSTPLVEEVQETSPHLPTVRAKPVAVPSKSPTKLKLKLPLNKSRKLSLPTNPNSAKKSTDDAEVVVKAMVIDSDDDGEDDAVANIIETAKPSKSTTPDAAPSSSSKSGARRPLPPPKAVRLPPMSSPGLLIPPGVSGPFRSTADPATGLATPAAIFDHAMHLAGYSTQARITRPHRGSSIQRQVGDMFDSNVKLTLHFPPLVPEEFTESKETLQSLADRLVRAVQDKHATPKDAAASTNGSKHAPSKRKLPGFDEMAPLSLTLPYPEAYLQKRLKYVQQVQERERAIVEWQEEELALDMEKEQREAAGETLPDDFLTPSTVVPPIPTPPTPPRLEELKGFDPEQYDDQYPLYFPKTNETKQLQQHSMVTHLDPKCFHITEGRYFGLVSNTIADPHVIGPNAVGLAGLSVSGGAGLATANSGGGGASGGATLLAAPSQSGASANANAHRGKSSSSNATTAESK